MAKLNSVSWGSRVFNVGWTVVWATVLSLCPMAVKADELEEIQSRSHLSVAIKDNLRPLGFRDDHGNLQGFEIDLARKLAEVIVGDAQAVEFTPVANRERLEVVIKGEVDLTIAQVGHTESRSRIVRLSDYYYLDQVALITRDPSLEEMRDLAGDTIAVLNESATIAQIKYHLPQAKLVGVDSYQQALSRLEQGEATAFAGQETVLSGWVQQYPDYKILRGRTGGTALAVVMPKGLQYSSLHRIVNETIRDLRESGWLQQKAKEWGLKSETFSPQ